jgi:hypothetical protein
MENKTPDAAYVTKANIAAPTTSDAVADAIEEAAEDSLNEVVAPATVTVPAGTVTLEDRTERDSDR